MLTTLSRYRWLRSVYPFNYPSYEPTWLVRVDHIGWVVFCDNNWRISP